MTEVSGQTEVAASPIHLETPGPRPIRPDAVLRVSELGVRFGPTVAVESVSFSVDRGEVLALVGESGSGKTVTAQAVLGLLPGSATAYGSVQLTDDPRGRPAHEQPNLLAHRDRRDPWAGVRGRLAAMVFQEPQTALNPVKTVGWQLSEALRAHRRLSRSAARSRAVELLTQVGIPDPDVRVDAYPHQLSGGQKQRVVIASALANDPVLLIADEPTTALDVSVQAEILALLGDLRDRLGMAVLLITHNMGVVADLADRVLVMRAGRMVERGEVVSLFSAPFTDYTRDLLGSVPRLRVVEPDAPPPDSTVLASPEIAVDGVRATTASAVAFRAASVDYPGRLGRPAFRALHDLSVEVAPGRVLGVVGESGSGKSTLGRAALGLLRAGAGRIEVAGVDLGTASRAELRAVRRRIGVVPQDPASTLDPLLDVGESVAEPLQVHRVASGRVLRQRVAELLNSVSLPSRYAGRRPHELSGGQRQRVALARALALRPELLIADEPTSALDVSVQAAVLAEFVRLRTELGFACVFISHDLAVVDGVSDEVLVLQDGTAVEHGATDRVLGRPEHPYTQGLLAAVPVPDPIEQRARR